MAKKKNKKIVRYRRPLNLNVGMIIFLIIFVYMSFYVVAYLQKEKVQFYEVVEGGIVNDKSCTGLILREEQVRNTDRAGYINYYLREGKRACVGTRIYSLDETGGLKSLLKDAPQGAGALSPENLGDLKKQLTSFVLSFRNDNFSTIYGDRFDLENSVMEYSSFSALDQLDQLASTAGVDFQQVTSDVSGVVAYGFDSYEGMRPEDVTAESFNRTGYTKTSNQSGARVDSDFKAYKIITSENWSIVFQLSDEDRERYSGRTALKVRFTDGSMTAVGDYSTFTGKDGAVYGKLDFSKYLEQFISDRFVEFEIISDQASGLKIPISAVTDKTFYLIPVEYITNGGDSSDTGFNKEVYSENGTSVVFVPTTVYASDDEYYYVNMGEGAEFKAGDYVVKPQSTDRFQIGRTASLKGVYNINKGYTVFKQIEIKDSNSEYYTVAQGTSYGLSVYDHIVLDASLVKEGDILYQ